MTRKELDRTFRDHVQAVRDVLEKDHVDELPVILDVLSYTPDSKLKDSHLVMPVLPDDEELLTKVFYGVGKTFYVLTKGCAPVYVCYTREVWIQGNEALDHAVGFVADKTRDAISKYQEGILIRAQTFDMILRSAIILVKRREDNSMLVGPTLYLGYSDFNTDRPLFQKDSPDLTLASSEQEKNGVGEINSFYGGVAAGIAGIKDDGIHATDIEHHNADEAKGSLSEIMRMIKKDQEDNDIELGKKLFGKN